MSLPRSVEIIAHRGASRDRLENTLSAFREALAQGADAFELDVHATRDGVVVVHHDPVVRWARVRAGDAGSGGVTGGSVGAGSSGGSRGSGSSGTGSLENQQGSSGTGSLESRSREPVPLEIPIETPEPLETPAEAVAIADLSHAELRTHILLNGETIPTLDDVLALAAGRATVYVEVKGHAIETDVLVCLTRHPETATAVHSFDHRIPHRIAELDSRVPSGILSASYPMDIPHMITSAGARDLWQHAALVDRALIDSAHSVGARVVVWTENDVMHAAQLVQMGVDAICTDIPGLMRAALAGARLVSPEPTYRS